MAVNKSLENKENSPSPTFPSAQKLHFCRIKKQFQRLKRKGQPLHDDDLLAHQELGRRPPTKWAGRSLTDFWRQQLKAAIEKAKALGLEPTHHIVVHVPAGMRSYG